MLRAGQLVLANEARRVAVQQRQRWDFKIRRSPAQTHDIGIKHCVLGDVRSEEQIGVRQLIGVSGRVVFRAFRPKRELRNDRRADADVFTLRLFSALQAHLRFFVDCLATVHTLALIGHSFFSAGYGLVVLRSVRIDVHFVDALNAGFRIG
jgi:hypothetical protein